MQLTFYGGARTVTGSMHLLEAAGKGILLDCGLFQGHRAEATYINSHFPFDPATIHAVILSHAHLDHAGNLPTLVKQGFTGHIYSTFATRDLAAVMLQDAAHIQERDAEYLNKRNSKKGKPPIYPLYQVRAQVVVMNGYSAHAGAPELEKYIVTAAKRAKGVFLVHSDWDQAQALAQRLKIMAFCLFTYLNAAKAFL